MNSCSRSWPIFLAAAVVFAIFVPPEDVSAQRGRRGGGRGGSGWEFVAKKYDADKDGTVTAEEYTRGEEGLKSLDKNGDGVLSKADWETGSGRGRGGSGDAPQVGETAPDFSLTQVTDKSKTVTLSEFADDRPVALLFGSCT
jgi:hypothetical protein